MIIILSRYPALIGLAGLAVLDTAGCCVKPETVSVVERRDSGGVEK